MNRRELERWVDVNHGRLFSRGVTLLFGFGPPEGPADRSSRVNAYAFADGACLREQRDDDVSAERLESLAELLAPSVAG